jgi:nucleotide-binding universal stress UspA family protein
VIKKIFVPISGGRNDEKLFATALSIARPLAAHMEFFHARLSACEAAVRTRHVGFCRGAAMTDALAHLQQQAATLSLGAVRHFEAFCARNEIAIVAHPGRAPPARPSAHFEQATDVAVDALVAHARHSDLIVVDRPDGLQVSPFNSIESLLLGTGRPVIIAAEAASSSPDRTVVVGWQETAEAARSLAAAIPLLQLARQVVLVSIAESQRRALPALQEVRSQLAWHCVNAQMRVERDNPRSASDHLLEIAGRLRAGLLVIGGFGRGPVREALFGGVTHSIIERANCPVFVMH